MMSFSSAYAVEFSSGPGKVQLLELYTSEGCSSCPPADAWFSELKKDLELFVSFIPVAFHVTYWDYLGWNDSLGSPEYTARQRKIAQAWRSPTVYTPGIVLDGKEFTGWRHTKKVEGATSILVGHLQLSTNDGQNFSIRYQPTETDRGEFEFHLAILGLGIQSAIRGGENRGRTLQHDFAVFSYQRHMTSEAVFKMIAATKRDVEVEKLAVAVWVSEPQSVFAIQATGGFLSS